jgi:hypothetical protein
LELVFTGDAGMQSMERYFGSLTVTPVSKRRAELRRWAYELYNTHMNAAAVTAYAAMTGQGYFTRKELALETLMTSETPPVAVESIASWLATPGDSTRRRLQSSFSSPSKRQRTKGGVVFALTPDEAGMKDRVEKLILSGNWRSLRALRLIGTTCRVQRQRGTGY